jgi:NarL family two-component system response regulator LiaR
MDPNTPIRVLLADDHEMVRRGLAVFIQSFDDLILIGEASDGQEAIKFLEDHQVDVLLMDLIMPRMGGLEAIQIIRQDYPDIKIIAMTSFEEEELVQQAVNKGAIGFLMKNTTIDELASAIRNAFAGKATLAPEAAQILIKAASQPPQPEYGLTAREMDVLTQMVDGKTNPEIAQVLSISRSTVKSHVSNILGKLNVSSRIEAIKLALESKLV